MDYLKEFLNLEEYETYKNGADFALPNVSLVNNPYSVKYTPYTPPNYFRITSLANVEGEIYFDAVRSSSYPQDESYPITLEYCVNGDGIWTSITGEEHIQITLPANGYVELRGDNISMANYNDDYASVLYWNLTVDFNHSLSGDIMSICGFSDTLEHYHFSGFFEHNTTLIDASNLILSASVLAMYCYEDMFKGCTSLISAPELPVMTLELGCYASMFDGCTSLTTAPELPATTLTGNCYSGMFFGCTNLNYIKAMFITEPIGAYTNTWVSGVASTGTFVKNPAATWDVTGVNGVPTGWDVEAMADEYFTTIAREDGTISFNILKSMDLQYIENIYYSIDNGETWNKTSNIEDKTENLVITVNVNKDDKILWKGSATQFGYWYTNDDEGIDDLVGSFFSSTCEFDVQGNIMSLLYGDNFKGQTTLKYPYTFASLFYDVIGDTNCKIVNAKNLSLPATTLTSSCYDSMFYNCTNLITTPELPATALANFCYQSMFYNCTSLMNAPKLPATTLKEACYSLMFKNCTNLTVAPELPATTLAERCYSSMFEYCTNLATAPELPATTLAKGCYSSMFEYCTNLATAPELPATTLAKGCYSVMFKNCTSLNYIKAMFTTTPSDTYTRNWVEGVSSTGTFIKNSNATWNVTGVHGVPTGWTIQTASE